MFKKIIKKFLPKNFLLFYHKVLAYLAGFFYGWPSEKMVVIGVTGTAGKSTVVNLIGRILEEAGYQVGWTSTMNFKIGKKEWLNKTKMTMLGRFALQKLLKQMVKDGCQYVIIETSSEGLAQSRHLGINYDLAVFTNLFPEHLEAHGGFENYKKAKGKLFEKLKIENKKFKIIDGKEIKKTIVVNLDDKNVEYFLGFPADEYYGYTIENSKLKSQISKIQIKNLKIIEAENIELSKERSGFRVQDLEFEVNLLGKFNVYNILAALSVAISQGVDLEICQAALEKIKNLAGRLEEINEGQDFKIFIDYAHTVGSLEKVYQLLSSLQSPGSKMIAVLGACGGGRDKWKRPIMGKIAAQYCNYIILTNEDPYDENPSTILDEIKVGFLQIQNQSTQNYLNARPSTKDLCSGSKFPGAEQVRYGVGKIQNYWKILDRREAIKKAIEIAERGDLIVITGKGCEPWIMGPNGSKIPWDDREITKKLLKETENR